ncbi:MAG: Helix-turn-helix domain [Paenibacillus sp.]|jgi:transcriptional regulator with XRE-family HTH domain|nr:Helix-turn-helix domain [Paenibacillus sp.]
MDNYYKGTRFPKTDKNGGDSVSTNLKQLRIAKEIKQQDMAKMLGYTATSYNKIENGERNLPTRKALLAAEILGCTLDEIFLPSDFPKRTNESD